MRSLLFSFLFLVGCSAGSSGSSAVAVNGTAYYSAIDGTTILASSKLWFKDDGTFEGFINFYNKNTSQNNGTVYCGTYSRNGTTIVISLPSSSDITVDINAMNTTLDGSKYPSSAFSTSDASKSYIDTISFPGLLPCP